MKLNRGFTLAEALVTLAVIGVIASICLPSLLGFAPNKEQIMLKKAYYLVGRNVNELINDEDFYPERNNENFSGFSNINISDQTADGREATFHGLSFSGNSKFCNLFSVRMNVRGNVNCDQEVAFENGGNFTSGDGIIWRLPVGENGAFARGEANTNQTIEIDVSGPAGCNCFEGACPTRCSVPDRFRIFVDRFGKITVPNGIEQEYLTRTTTNTSYADVLKGIRRQ